MRTIYRDIDRLIAPRRAGGGGARRGRRVPPLGRISGPADRAESCRDDGDPGGARADARPASHAAPEASRSGGGEAARGAAAGGPRNPRQGLARRRHRTGARRHFSPRAAGGAAGRSAWRRRPVSGRNPDAAPRRAGAPRLQPATERCTTSSRTACSSTAISGISSAARSRPTRSACGAPTASSPSRVTGMAFRPQRGFRHPHDARPPMAGAEPCGAGTRTRRRTRIRISAEAAERLRRDWYYRHATSRQTATAVVMTIPDTDPGTDPAARALARRRRRRFSSPQGAPG